MLTLSDRQFSLRKADNALLSLSSGSNPNFCKCNRSSDICFAPFKKGVTFLIEKTTSKKYKEKKQSNKILESFDKFFSQANLNYLKLHCFILTLKQLYMHKQPHFN